MSITGHADENMNYLHDELYRFVRENPVIFDFIQDGSLDGIWYWDLEKPSQEWMSPRFWEVFGYNPEEKPHLAEAWQDMINEADLKVALDNFHKHCEDPNHPYDQIVRYRHKNGSTVWVRCRGIAIRNGNGMPIRMLGAHTDVTALKEAETELRKKTEELERINAELAQFAYAASHDLQAPLNTISSYVGLLQQKYAEAFDDEGKALMKVTVDAATRMTSLIHGLLEFSHLTNDELNVEVVDCNQLLDETQIDLKQAIDREHAVISRGVCPVIIGYRAMLGHVFQNLISNALKFRRPKEFPKIHIAAEDEGDHWTFSVCDNGVGIDPKFHKEIFQLFKRLYTRSEYEGTGLGLALCRKVVVLHGGKIWVSSHLGEGSTFYFTVSKKLKIAND